MKKIFFIAIALCCMVAEMLAADVIITRNTAEIEVKVIEVTSSHVLYKSWKEQKGQTFTFPLELVAKIRYNDGRVVEFNTIEHEDFEVRDIYGDGVVNPDATVTEYIARDGSLVRETTVYRKTETLNADSLAAVRLQEERERAATIAAEQKRQEEIAAAKRAKQMAKIQELMATSAKQKKYSTIDFVMGGTLLAGGIAGLACAPFVDNQPASLISGGALCVVGSLGIIIGSVDLKKSKKNAAAAAAAQSKLQSGTLTLQVTGSDDGVGVCLNF